MPSNLETVRFYMGGALVALKHDDRATAIHRLETAIALLPALPAEPEKPEESAIDLCVRIQRVGGQLMATTNAAEVAPVEAYAEPAKVWHVGDTGPNGGTIVKVYPPGDPRVALECDSIDWPAPVTWDQSNIMIGKWRLPTRKQMRYIAEHVELADDWYWTREEWTDQTAVAFGPGMFFRSFEKTEPHRVRAVRYIGEGK